MKKKRIEELEKWSNTLHMGKKQIITEMLNEIKKLL